VICPYCGANDDRVIDSRTAGGGRAIRRRRQCVPCGKRFTTYEPIERSNRLTVIKRDGSREGFSPEKILAGVRAACGKRPVPEAEKVHIVEQVEEELHREYDREVEARVIGEKVAERLRELDEIAYIRFASEYEQFTSVGDIMETINQLSQRVRDVKAQQKLFNE